MTAETTQTTIKLNPTSRVCPIGETVGRDHIKTGKTPVISCEGACIRGEIARLAANYIAKEEHFGRGCHGELITVPDSAISSWIRSAETVVLIDGCFLRCHGRIIENIIDRDRLVQFDALSYYNRYTDIFDYEDVPEPERKETAREVADWVLEALRSGTRATPPSTDDRCSACCSN